MEANDILPNLTTPKGLEFRESAIKEGELGIWCSSRIPKGDKFGPFEGTKVYNSKQTLNPQYAWEVLDQETGKLLYYIDASDETKANWMRFVRCARYFEEQNIVSKQEGCDVYYAAINDIEPGEELLTWYDMTEYNESLKKRGNKKNLKKKMEAVEEVPSSPSKAAKGKGKTKMVEETSEDGVEKDAKKTKKKTKQKEYAESEENNESEKSDSCEGHKSDSNNEQVDNLNELTESSLDKASKKNGKVSGEAGLNSAENESKSSEKVVIGKKRVPKKKLKLTNEKVTDRSEGVAEESEKMESIELQKSENVGEVSRDFDENVSEFVKCPEKVVIRNKRGPKKKSKLRESNSVDIADKVNGDSSEKTEVCSERAEVSSLRSEAVATDENGDKCVNGEESRMLETGDKHSDACENWKDSDNVNDKEPADCSDVSESVAKDTSDQEDVTLSSSPAAHEDNNVADNVAKNISDKEDVTFSSSPAAHEDNNVADNVAKNIGDKEDATLSPDSDEDKNVAEIVAKNIGDKKDVTLSTSSDVDVDKNGKDVTLEEKHREGIPMDVTCNATEMNGDKIENEMAGDGSTELVMDLSICPDDVLKSDVMDCDSGVDADESGKNADSCSVVDSTEKIEENSANYAKEAEIVENIPTVPSQMDRTPDKDTEPNDLVTDLKKTSENGSNDIDHRLVNNDRCLLEVQDVQSDCPLNLSMKSESSVEGGEKKRKPYALGQLESMTNALKVSTGEEKCDSSILRAAFAGRKITADVPHKPVQSPQGSISPSPLSPTKLGLTGTKPGIVFHNLTPELVEQNLFKNSRCSYGRYTPVGRGVTQFVSSSPKVLPKPEPVVKKFVGTAISSSTKDTAKPESLQKPDGQYYQFEIQSHHHCIENGRQIYRCDVCSGSYRHAFSLKRHFIRNHVNHKYVSDADLINCCVNIKKPTEQTLTESKKICDMIRSAGYENEPSQQSSDTKTENSQQLKLESDKDAMNLESEIVNKLPNLSNASVNEQKSAPGDKSPPGEKKESVIILSRASEDTDCAVKSNDNLVILQSTPKKWPGLFRCNACGATFDELPLLTTHYLNHPSKKEGRMFTCDKCFMKFSHKHNLIRHRSSHQITSSASKHSTVSIRGVPEGGQQGDPIFQCKLCPAFFLHRGYLMKHIRVMHGRQRNACAFCSKHFESETKLETHLRITHDQSLESNKATMLKNCPKTPTDLDKNQSMKLSNRAQGYKYACTVCKKRFKEYRIMCRHRRLAHQSGRTPLVPEKAPRVELVIPTPKRSLFLDDSPFFYANVAKNISDNLNMHVDGKIESLGNPSVHFRVKDGAIGLNSCDTKLPESEFWVKYNVNPEFPPKLKLTSVKPAANDQSRPHNVRPEHAFAAPPYSGVQWPCTAECNQRRRKNGFKNFYADDNEDKKYICMVCKREFEFFMDFDDHRWEVHPNVNCTHIEVNKDSYPPIFVPPTFHGMLNDTPSDVEKVYPSSFKCTKCNSNFDLIDKLHEHIVSCAVKGKGDQASSSSNSNSNGYGSQLLGDFKKNQYAQMKKGFKVKHRLQHRAQLKSLAAQKAKEEKLQNKIKKQRKSRYEREQGIGYNDRGFEFNVEAELNEDGTQKRRNFFQLPYNPKKHKRRRDMTQVVDMHMCGGCRKRFKTLGLLERHGRICSEKEKLNKAEAIAVPKREISGALKCKYCAKVFTYKASLRRHLMDICRIKKDLIARNILSPTELETEKIMIDNMAEKTYDGQESVHSSEVGSEMTNEPEEDLMLPRRIGYWRGKKRKGRKKNNRWAKSKIPKKTLSTDSKEGAEDDSKTSVEESMALGESAGTLSLELLKLKPEVKALKGLRTFKRRQPLVRHGYRYITELVPDALLTSTPVEDGAADDGKRRRKRTFKAQEQANIEMVLDDMECYIEDGAAPKKKKRRKLKPGMEGSNSGSFSSSLEGSVSVSVPLDRVAQVPVSVLQKVRQRPGPKKGWKLAKLQAQKMKWGEIVPTVTEEESKPKMQDLGKADIKRKEVADDNSPSAPAVVKKRPGPKKGWKLKMKLMAKAQTSNPDVSAENPPTDVSKTASVSAQEEEDVIMENVERVRGKPGPKKGWKLAKLGLPPQNAEVAVTTGPASETDTSTIRKPVVRRKPKGLKPRFQAKKYIASVVGEILDEAVPSAYVRKKSLGKRGPLPKGDKIAKGVKDSPGEPIPAAPTSEIALDAATNVPMNSESDSKEVVPVVAKKPRGPKKGWKLERAKAAELAESLQETVPESVPEPASIPVEETNPEKPAKRKPGPKKGWKLLKKEEKSVTLTSSGTGRGRKSHVTSSSPTRKNSCSPNRKVSPGPTRKEVTDPSPKASSNPTGKVAAKGKVGGEPKVKRDGKVAVKRGRKPAVNAPDSPEKRVLIERGPGKRVVKIKKAVLAPPTRGRKRAIKDGDTKAKTLVKRRKIDGLDGEGMETDETLTVPPSGLVLNDMDHIDGVETSLVQKNKSCDSIDMVELNTCTSRPLSVECASSSGVSSGATSDNSFETTETTGADVNSPTLTPVQSQS
ncbi:uncharacterized protein LOC135496641 [Lineus longissimus]|uniref:uncharacterized protein LOC135496641 n=1 Tax=Lineus longissimus TaxID=88925 RepID=UPI00315CE714